MHDCLPEYIKKTTSEDTSAAITKTGKKRQSQEPLPHSTKQQITIFYAQAHHTQNSRRNSPYPYLSSQSLNTEQLTLLTKGLSFAPTPQINYVNTMNLQDHFDQSTHTQLPNQT